MNIQKQSEDTFIQFEVSIRNVAWSHLCLKTRVPDFPVVKRRRLPNMFVNDEIEQKTCLHAVMWQLDLPVLAASLKRAATTLICLSNISRWLWGYLSSSVPATSGQLSRPLLELHIVYSTLSTAGHLCQPLFERNECYILPTRRSPQPAFFAHNVTNSVSRVHSTS